MTKKLSSVRSKQVKSAHASLINRPPGEYDSMLAEQLDLLQFDCAAFDAGRLHFSPQIAIKLRVFLYDKPNPNSRTPSVSLLSQLGLTNKEFFNSEYCFTNGNQKQCVSPSRGMVFSVATIEGGKPVSRWKANLLVQNQPNYTSPLKPFAQWWEMLVIPGEKMGTGFSRRAIVTAVANHDNGGHIAPKIEARYFALTRMDQTNYFQSYQEDNKEPIVFSNEGSGRDLARAVVRQIAHEVLLTFLADPKDYLASIPNNHVPAPTHPWIIFDLIDPLHP